MVSYHEIEGDYRRGGSHVCTWSLRAPAGALLDTQPILPDGFVELLFHRGDSVHEVKGNATYEQTRVLVAGAGGTATRIQPAGVLDVLGVRMTPWAAASLLNVRADEISGRITDGALVHRRLARWSAETEGLDDAACHVYFARLLENLAQHPYHSLLSALTLGYDPAGSSTTRLARAAGVSARHVQSLFAQHIGLTPKQHHRIQRMQRVMKLGASQPDWSITRIAITAGFYDNAHLVRDCRHIADCTPSDLLGVDRPVTNAFLSA